MIMAGAYDGLGEIDRAIAWLEQAIAERTPNVVYLKVAANLDALRNDPRFQAVLRRMTFPPS